MLTYMLNERVYTLYHSLEHDLCFEPGQSYIFDLSHLGALDVSGENAATFLQGQLTCDVHAVTATQMRPSGRCSLQGRLLGLMDVIAWQNLHLIMPKDLLSTNQQALAKAGLFSRVTLKINPLFTYVGLYIPHSAIPKDLSIPLPTAPWHATHNTERYCYALSDQLFIFVLRDPAQKKSFLAEFTAEQHRGSLAWHYLELQRLRMTLYPNTRGLFLPHRLNLQTTPYLSFSKGCYKGQEIIARTHYRAKLKHTVKLFQVTTTELIFAGQKFYADLSHQREIGEIIDFCPLASDQYLLALSILADHPTEVYFEQHTTSLRW